VDSKELNTIPNMITISRILASPSLSLAIAYDLKMVALGGCVLFGFSDWLDGYLAQRLNQRTVLGAFLDPMADKFMIGAIATGTHTHTHTYTHTYTHKYECLLLNLHTPLSLTGLVAKNMLPLELCVLIIGRDVLLVGSVFAMRARDRPAGRCHMSYVAQ
jgi:phosphatidylglycerophosphate synthase